MITTDINVICPDNLKLYLIQNRVFNHAHYFSKKDVLDSAFYTYEKEDVLYASFCGIHYRMYGFTFNWYFVRKSAPIWNFILLKSIQSSDYYITKSGSGRI